MINFYMKNGKVLSESEFDKLSHQEKREFYENYPFPAYVEFDQNESLKAWLDIEKQNDDS